MQMTLYCASAYQIYEDNALQGLIGYIQAF